MIEFLNKLAYLSSFFTIGNVLGVSSILIAVLIAIWQFCVAQRAQAKLESIVKTLPNELLNSVKSFVEQPNEPANEILSKDYGLSAKMADLDGDGEDELLISSPFGPHGSRLQVFGFREWEFQKIDEITVMAPSDFELEKGDGGINVVAIDIAETPHAYVCGFRDEVRFRLGKVGFREVSRTPLYKPHELAQGHVDEDDS